ncbi:MAG: 4-alpha-glucanotransferase [Magnetospirillum sp.]|nr:4-alpha-glucanotransferase [Magnetospirillum sp.]
MSDDGALDRLAQMAGIEDGWWDFFGVWRVVPAETKRAFLEAMGFAVGDTAAVLGSLSELESRSWRRPLEPVLVLDEHGDAPSISVTLPADCDSDQLEWTLEAELGAVHHGSCRVGMLARGEEREVDGVVMRRRWLRLPDVPPVGYHRFRLAGAEMTIVVAPAGAHVPAVVEPGHKAWGIATQIYALRSSGDWGVGTYAALGELAAGAAGLGAAAVGVNPLHALFPAQPERFSPYAPSSRRFLNTAYIDVEAIPEFAECRQAKRMFASPGFQAGLARVRAQALVEYADAGRLARPILDLLYTCFREEHGNDARGQAFRDFQIEGGRSAERFATFAALPARFLAEGQGYWRQWPEEFRHPESPAVAAFAVDNRDKVEFFWWLQFVADQQLAAAQAAGKAAGMGIGLYRDLGVGIAGDGAEAWAEQDVLALGPSVGAPPDPLALKGQDWGLVPFNPIALREKAYEPFIAVMRANMRHAGALRLDHAMSLQRLYWVPPGLPADQGAYVRYPVDDLFRLVALESRRNRCLVIGEDLGTVPEGFRERMDRMGIFAYRVMVFEKDAAGQVRKPDDYDELALAIFATHDLPSARGWWAGVDVDKRRRLDLYPRSGMADEEREARARDRDLLVAALAGEGLLPADFPTGGLLDQGQAEALTTAAHCWLARARSRLMMVQIEDVLALDMQMNLPGTVDQHPNWRPRYPEDIAALLADPRLGGLADRLRASRA